MPQPADELFARVHQLRTCAWMPGQSLELPERGGAPERMVIRRTLRGTGFFRNASGFQAVPPGMALLSRGGDSFDFQGEENGLYVEQHVVFTAPCLEPIFDQLSEVYGAVVQMPLEGEAASVFFQIERSVQDHAPEDPFSLSAQMHRLLMTLFREQGLPGSATDPIELGYRYIRNQYALPIDIHSVARQAGVSYEYFIRSFSKRYGMSPGAFLTSVRLESSKSKLEMTNMRVKEIARQSGFGSSKAFCRIFRRRFGVSPKQWRAGGFQSQVPCVLAPRLDTRAGLPGSPPLSARRGVEAVYK